MEHHLKIKTEYLLRIADGHKTFEIRSNDRDYQVGDFLILDDGDGPSIKVKVTYISNYPDAIKDGWVILAIKWVGLGNE